VLTFEKSFDPSTEILAHAPVRSDNVLDLEGNVIRNAVFYLYQQYAIQEGVMSARMSLLPSGIFFSSVGAWFSAQALTLKEIADAMNRSDDRYDILLEVMALKGWGLTPVFGIVDIEGEVPDYRCRLQE
jgi:hypothetical protein